MISQHFKIKGMVPYVFSRPVKEEKTPKTEAEKKQSAINRVYQHEGKLYIPNNQIKGVIKSGISRAKMKIEKSNLRALQLVKALVYVNPDIIFLKNGKQLTMDDIELKEVHIPVDNGKLIWSWVATIPAGWECEFNIESGEALEPKFIETALFNGGLLASVGGMRPECGRFEII
jgi:hypothetical protein